MRFFLSKFIRLTYHADMNWQELVDPDIQKFITAHKDDDVQTLALKKPPNPDWPYGLILDQIKASQKIKKLPIFDEQGVIFPPADLVEQASSWACALYKASLFSGNTFVDLTAGSGSDTIALAQKFTQSIAVERDSDKAGILRHNLGMLEIDSIDVKNAVAEDFANSMAEADLVYIDPQRRDGKRRGIYALSDCSPNILTLLDQIKARNILIKTSPVLDIKKTLLELKCVSRVYIVEYEGECKELLFCLTPSQNIDVEHVPICAVQIDRHGKALKTLLFTLAEENKAKAEYTEALAYLYEPSPAFQKAGAFKFMAQHFGLTKLHPNTHLYTSLQPNLDFPGRIFKVTGVTAVNHKALKAILPDMKANLTIRNFPMAVPDLRKKLKIADGGDITLFACTDHKEGKIIIKCEKY